MAASISTMIKIRKRMYREPVATRPRAPRPSAEPAGRGRLALYRAGRARAVLARQARCSMAFVPSASPTLFRGAPERCCRVPASSRCTEFARWWHSVVCTECHRRASPCVAQAPGTFQHHSRCTAALARPTRRTRTVNTSSASWQSGARLLKVHIHSCNYIQRMERTCKPQEGPH